jgi:hypothetical protein
MAIESFYKSMTWKQLTGTDVNDKYENDETYTTTTINGYIGSRTDRQVFMAGKWTIQTQYKFYADQETNHGDIIIFESKNYRVIGQAQNTVNKAHHYKTYVERLDNIT